MRVYSIGFSGMDLAESLKDLTLLFQTVLVLILGVTGLFLWRRHLRPRQLWRYYSSGLDQVSVEGAKLDMADYLWLPLSKITGWFLLAWFGWALFYAHMFYFSVASLDPVERSYHTFLNHVLSNVTTVFFISFFFELSAPRTESKQRREFTRVLRSGWLFLMLVMLTLEYLHLRRNELLASASYELDPYTQIYGIAQGLALFLLIGRLSDVTIADHLSVTGGFSIKRTYDWLILSGYIYAAMQPLYPILLAFDSSKMLLLLAIVGIPLKLALFTLINLLLEVHGESICALRHYLYDVERFTNEELGSYERQFARAFALSQKRRPAKDGGSGFLGIEYAHLNDFKREHLFLMGDGRNLLGGVLVKEVYAKSNAMECGIRPGDYITHIDGVPLGRSTMLGTLLSTLAVGKVVEIRLLRKRFPEKEVSSPSDYEQISVVIPLVEYEDIVQPRVPECAKARLGLQYMYHGRSYGAVCTIDPEGHRLLSATQVSDLLEFIGQANGALLCSAHKEVSRQTRKLKTSFTKRVLRHLLRLRCNALAVLNIRDRLQNAKLAVKYFKQSEAFMVKGMVNVDRNIAFRVPDIYFLRAMMEQVIPGERIQLRVNGRLSHSPILTTYMAGYSIDEACRVKVTLDLVSVPFSDHDTLFSLYKDRFVGTPLSTSSGIAGAPGMSLRSDGGRVYLLAFDTSYARLFEYYCEAEGIKETLESLPIWDRVDRGDFYLFIGQPMPMVAEGRDALKGGLIFNSGEFYRVKHHYSS